RKVRALDGLSLTIEAGHIFGFLGANGAGKTTTLKLLMRLIFPTAGTARILDRDISDVSMRARIGYLPENPYFYDYLTAREFIDLIASLNSEGKTVFMCSHILSDIQVLCDSIAILKGGKLAHAGTLDELRTAEANAIEIIASGADADRLKSQLKIQAEVTTTPSGLRIAVGDEKDVGAVIAAHRSVNGKLVAVNPVKQSLEELFL